MRIRIATGVLLSLLFISLAIQPDIIAHADEADVNYYAVIVGVADYPGWINDLSHTADASMNLSNQLTPIWGEDNVKLLIDSEATKSNIRDAVCSWLDERADANDVVLFSYSGHGLPDYLCPYDSLILSYARNIGASELAGWLNNLESKNVVVVLESCYSGSFTSVLSKTGRIVLTSGSADQASYDGVFMGYIAEAISKFTDADTNRDYELSIEEVFTYASSKVSNYVTKDLYDYQDPQIDDRYEGKLGVFYESTFNISPQSLLLTVIIDGHQYNTTELPVSFRWIPGSSHSFEINSSSPDWVSMPTRTISEGGEYNLVYLTVESDYGNPQGEGWYMEGTSASVSVTSPQGAIVRDVFSSWSGDSTVTTFNATILMDRAMTVTAQWHKNYVQLYILLAGLLGIALVSGVFLKKRGGRLLLARNNTAINIPDGNRPQSKVNVIEQQNVVPPVPSVSEQIVTMYCSNCGAKVSKAVKFCKECGYNLKEESEKDRPPKISADSKCAIHQARNAIGICNTCGNGVCDLCRTVSGDKLYCMSCFNRIINKPATLKVEPIKEDLKTETPNPEVLAAANAEVKNKANQESVPRTQRFNWFRERPNVTIFLAGMLCPLTPLLSLYVISRGFNSMVSGLLETLYQNPSIIPIIFLPLDIFSFIVINWACKYKGRSVWWGLLIVIPFVWLFTLIVCDHSYYFCVDSKGIANICHYTEYKAACALLPIAWIILMALPKRISTSLFVKTSN